MQDFKNETERGTGRQHRKAVPSKESILEHVSTRASEGEIRSGLRKSLTICCISLTAEEASGGENAS